jgi:hypothetical protein
MAKWRNWRVVRGQAVRDGRITEEGITAARRARELAMAESYERFYGGERAPVPEGTAALWGDGDAED